MNKIVKADPTRDDIEVVKRTVAKGASDIELKMFFHIANKYGLDPLTKEIWCVRLNGQSGPMTIFTSRDGYLKVAQANSSYKGINSGIIYEGQKFTIDYDKGSVSAEMDGSFISGGKIVAGWAVLTMEGRRPFIQVVPFKEYAKNNKVWQSYPSAMIEKVAQVRVLKMGCGISGLVTMEEMGQEEPKETIDLTPKFEAKKEFVKPSKPKLVKKISEVFTPEVAKKKTLEPLFVPVEKQDINPIIGEVMPEQVDAYIDNARAEAQETTLEPIVSLQLVKHFANDIAAHIGGTDGRKEVKQHLGSKKLNDMSEKELNDAYEALKKLATEIGVA